MSPGHLFLKRISARLGLEAKFVFLATAVLIVGSSIANRLVYSHEQDERLQTAEEKGRLLAESMAVPFTHTLLYKEIGLVEETGLLDSFIRDISKIREVDVQTVMVFDPHGRVIAHTDFREYGQTYRDDATGRALAGRATVVQRYRLAGTAILDVATPLQIGSKRWGTLRLLIGLNRVEADLRAYAQRLVLLMAVSVLIGIVLALAVARALALPIKRLTAAMEAVGADFQANLIVDRSDEIGQLQRSFLHMLARLRSASDERVQIQRRLIHTERLASIGTLASGVAHEVNNPLAGLRSCIQRILRHPDNAAQIRQYGELMLKAVGRIGDIVRGMLDFAHRSSGDRELFQMADVLNETLGLIDYQLRKHHIGLETAFAPDLPSITGDQGRIGQVFLNLMMNALDAMPEGGTLSVSCGAEEGHIATRFRDTGRGIPDDQINRIFDPFFTTKDVGKGTGLGLSIAHGIVEEHGGRIAVESTPGQGTEFVVYLPVTEREAI